jgi:integrase
MRGKITKLSVDALKPGAGGAEAVLWDSELKGFGVRVQRGGGKSYVLHYRAGTGRGAPLRKLTIGRHGSPWTPDTARHEAKRLLGLVESGADPAADKMARREASTIAQLAERFFAEHAEAKRKASTAAEYRRLLDKIILPAIGKRKVGDATRADVTKLHHANRSAPYQANRLLAVLSKMFNLAERWGLRPDGSNPCRHVEKFGERKRERMLSPAELARLGDALAAHDGSPYAVAAIKLLVFTGARLGEVLGLRWEWVDVERGEARLPDDSKTGAKTLHLPPPALAVLSELPRLDGNQHVVAGAKLGAPLVNLEKPWRAVRDRVTLGMWRDSEDEKIATLFAELCQKLDREPTVSEFRKAAVGQAISLPVGLTDVRIHDLRHAFASVAASSGMGLPIIGKMVGHSQPATTARYAHLASDPVKAAAATVAGKIAAAMAGGSGDAGKGSPTVVPLRSGGHNGNG